MVMVLASNVMHVFLTVISCKVSVCSVSNDVAKFGTDVLF